MEFFDRAAVWGAVLLALSGCGGISENKSSEITTQKSSSSSVVYIPSSSSSSSAASSTLVAAYFESETPALAPVALSPAGGKRLDATYFNAALSPEGELVFWGSMNGKGLPDNIPPIKQFESGAGYFLLLHYDGSVSELLFDDSDTLQYTALDIRGAVNIAAGKRHRLALLDDGSIVAWGANEAGQTDVPLGLEGVVDIAAGEAHSFALLVSGELVHWGDPSYKPPVPLLGVSAIDVYEQRHIALFNDGHIATWGVGWVGYYFEPPKGLTQEYAGVAVDAGPEHFLVKRSDGKLVGFEAGQYIDLPYSEGRSEISEFAAGQDLTLARNEEGELVVWGYGANTILPADIRDVQLIGSSSVGGVFLKRDGEVFEFEHYGDPRVIGRVRAENALSLQRVNVDFGVLYRDGSAYFGSAPDLLYNVIISTDNVPDDVSQPIKQMFLGRTYTTVLYVDGRLAVFGDERRNNILAGLEPIERLISSNAGYKKNGDYVEWDIPLRSYESETIIDTPPLGKSGIVQLSRGGNNLVLTDDGQLTYWTSAWEIAVDYELTADDGFVFEAPRVIGKDIQKFSMNAYEVIALTDEGRLEHTSFNTRESPCKPPVDIADVVDVSISQRHCFALQNNGNLVFWGSNIYIPINFQALISVN